MRTSNFEQFQIFINQKLVKIKRFQLKFFSRLKYQQTFCVIPLCVKMQKCFTSRSKTVFGKKAQGRQKKSFEVYMKV